MGADGGGVVVVFMQLFNCGYSKPSAKGGDDMAGATSGGNLHQINACQLELPSSPGRTRLSKGHFYRRGGKLDGLLKIAALGYGHT